MIISEIILILIPLILLGKIIVRLVSSIRTHHRTMNGIKDWSEFNQVLLLWSDEIKDTKIRTEYLNFVLDRSLGSNCLNEASINGVDLLSYNIPEIKQEIIVRFSDHIPSLKQEIREEKINKILENG